MAADITESISHSVWNAWGDPTHAHPLGENALAYLQSELSLESTAPTHQPVELSDVHPAPSSLPETAIHALGAIVGDANVATDDVTRIVHAGGKSTTDLLRRRSGDVAGAPDAVVFPGGNEEVAEILAFCAIERIAVVPFGGGTSVVGGVEPLRGPFASVIILDLGRLNRLLSLDTESRTATFQAGIRGPAIEAALAQHGFTLGHLPQSHQQATLGGYAATRSAGQSSTGYGRSDELVTAIRAETPSGTLNLGGHAPADATGPHLTQLLLGSEGVLGVITEVTVRVVPRPAEKSYGAWAFPSFEAGAAALRALIQDTPSGDLPAVVRLSDVAETAANFEVAGGRTVALLRRYLAARGLQHPALALFVWEGARGQTAGRKRRCARVFRAHGGVYVTAKPASSWDDGRFLAPYRRDELLTRGVFVETLETAASWSRLAETHAAVHDALTSALGSRCHLQTHVSHVYPGGASLYYTVLAPLEGDGLEQYRRMKTAASEAIVRSGATISHHHAVGIDHAPYLAAEIGELGLAVLAAVKRTLDPVGIMNPGKLIGQTKAGTDD
ncbi:FAD-binding oxidoreductase [Homoserinimonas sp. A520]